MSKFTFLVICEGGVINLKEFLPKTSEEIRIDFVDGLLQCYMDVEADTPLLAGRLIGTVCDKFSNDSEENWTVDQDYTMDGESYSLDEDEPLGRYLGKAGHWK